VASWYLGNHLSICLKTRGKQEKPCVEVAGRRTFRILTASQQSGRIRRLIGGTTSSIHILNADPSFGSVLHDFNPRRSAQSLCNINRVTSLFILLKEWTITTVVTCLLMPTTETLLESSMDATCFGRVDHHKALNT
jgi:hypothetical protein